MAILPEGFALPPVPYLVVLALSVVAVAGALYRISPPVTERTVLGFAPWMVLGSALYVCYQIGALPSVVAPFFGSPAVYLTTFVLLGVLWTVSNRSTAIKSETRNATTAGDWATDGDPTATGDRTDDPATAAIVLGTVGSVLALGVIAVALWIGLRRGSLRVLWPTIGLCVSVALGALTWAVVRRGEIGATGLAGALVVFTHTLDGVSTAVGVDVLGFSEQTPLARVFLEAAAALPVADLLGTGWLFVAVKIVLAVVVTWLLADSVRERPREGYLLCAFVAAVGLGPGAHNLLLFAVV